MDIELLVLNSLTRALPPLPGCGVLANSIRAFYARKPRKLQQVIRDNLHLELNPTECVDGGFLFYPQLYDRREMAVMDSVLRPGDTFVDLGANIGLYSLRAARMVGSSGRVLSFEPDPYSLNRLRKHRDLNAMTCIEPIGEGVADTEGEFRLTSTEQGNRGGSSMLPGAEIEGKPTEGTVVRCRPLLSFLEERKVEGIRLMKIDIEGFEYRVLRSFLDHAERRLWPDYVLLEHHSSLDTRAGGSSLALAIEHGYEHLATLSGINAVLRLDRRIPRAHTEPGSPGEKL